ncbi:hypothetical protein GIB67_024211 [Kingdonia uniflora]|uniref:Uncharacterized protein n=1 Tax=Kingdonia uniflora TaxID=39325 RepID=A0A7J7LZG4_9MAGN|nr:hypothetical protein GIB67_024211 [Kingdonia uniflora]
MDDSVVIGTVTADNPFVPSGRGVGLHAGDETGQFFKYPENVDVANKFLQYKKSLDGEWGDYVMNAGLWFKTLVRPSGNVEDYQVLSLDRWKRSMDIGDDIDIVYYNGTGSKVVEEGFLCYLNQVAYGLSIPITFFQKRVMNALKSCPGQLNGNIFEMMRVCKVLNQKWRDGGIARQFVADDVLKYYKFEYVKDRKSGYLFNDLARPKFFEFKSSGRPWCDHLVMVRGNCMQVPGEPTLELIYKNFNEKPKPKVIADTSSLFDIVSREGSELNKVFGELGIRKEKRLNSVVEKVHRAHKKRAMVASGSAYADVMEIPACVLSIAWKSAAKVLKLAAANRTELVWQHDAEKTALQEYREDVDLALAGKYGEIIFPGDDASPVAEQTPAPPVDDDPTKEEVVHSRGKVIEMEKPLSRARDSINRTQQVEDKENDNVAALSASNKKLSAKLQQCSLAVERKALLNSKLESEMLELESRLNVVTVELSCKDAKILTANNKSEQWKESLKEIKSETMVANQQVLDLLSNKVCEELHTKYKESQRMMDAAEAEINYSREVDNKLHRLKQEVERSVQKTRQYRGSLLQEKKSLEARCKDLDDELNKVKTEFYEATLLTAENVTLRVMAMLHADAEKF